MNIFQIPDLESLGVKFYRKPELPAIEFKKDKIHYTVTDIRLLNQVGVNVLETIINHVVEEPDAETLTFLREGVNDHGVNVITDIVMGIWYKVEKKGRNGYFGQGNFLMTSVEISDKEVIFHISKDHAGIVREYIRNRMGKNENINFYELVVEVADRSIESLIEHDKADRE